MPKAKSPIESTKPTVRIIGKLKRLDGATISELDGHLDMRFLEAGPFARHRRQIYEAARAEMTGPAGETSELANLVVEEHGCGVYIHRASGERAVKVDSFTGQRAYLHNTALGRAILSRLLRLENETVRYSSPHENQNPKPCGRDRSFSITNRFVRETRWTRR
ncbi:IclR family transcriptional regulator domain-containing protein [Salinigranum salinum]|uniref:IclR family transcriptional regulator domain-containing protein n=1 Tax=Salinigranum salinum TaxID=1364937 RepID=UPI001863D8FC|nr:hypothetical protein [Salinigranum salinum]